MSEPLPKWALAACRRCPEGTTVEVRRYGYGKRIEVRFTCEMCGDRWWDDRPVGEVAECLSRPKGGDND